RDGADQRDNTCENCGHADHSPCRTRAPYPRPSRVETSAVAALPGRMAAAPSAGRQVVLRSWRTRPNHRDSTSAPVLERFLPETWPAANGGFSFLVLLFNAALRVALGAMRRLRPAHGAR